MSEPEQKRPGRPALRRRASRVAAVLVLGVAGFLGGVGTTSILPTTVQTQHYEADVRLSPLPTQASTLHSPTTFGDIDLEFGGWAPAPGIDAPVQLKASVTELFNQRPVSLDLLEPAPHEVDDALRSAIIQLGAKFVGGALLTQVVLLGLLAVGRRAKPTRVQAVIAVIATTGAVLVPAGSAWYAYRPDNLAAFKTTSLLGTVRSNAGLLADVRVRAEQATPYVQNLLALSQALQEKFVPQELDKPAAARFLLVSDIHGANQYPIMKKIIEDEHITAVIDTGDLLNFGNVKEAEVAGLFQSIQSLPVPYVFVRGNHDASSPQDQSLLQRMARIPNVILLEPTPDRYIQVDVHGITIAGFNDPRYFGDDNKNNDQKQKPAIAAFKRVFQDRHPRPDILMSHEPSAVEAVKAGQLRINGHMHVAEVQGNRIQIGTFTGGGTVSHFLTGATTNDQNGGHDEGELTGQPYSFDIAVFGENCSLQSLTTYTYRNLIQGRPVYDDVSVVNGKTIANAPAEGRTCSPSMGVSKQEVDADEPPQETPSTTPVPPITPTVPVSPISPVPSP
jgi:predicted MPP superfamily phosphohydrolase